MPTYHLHFHYHAATEPQTNVNTNTETNSNTTIPVVQPHSRSVPTMATHTQPSSHQTRRHATTASNNIPSVAHDFNNIENILGSFLNTSLNDFLTNDVQMAFEVQTSRPNQTTSNNILQRINNHTTLYSIEDDESNECTICQQPLEKNNIVRKINACNHSFHSYCLDKWLESHVTCPNCRETIGQD
jgi:hypothetical protein